MKVVNNCRRDNESRANASAVLPSSVLVLRVIFRIRIVRRTVQNISQPIAAITSHSKTAKGSGETINASIRDRKRDIGRKKLRTVCGQMVAIAHKRMMSIVIMPAKNRRRGVPGVLRSVFKIRQRNQIEFTQTCPPATQTIQNLYFV